MTGAARDNLIMEPLLGYEPEIARLLWMLENSRHRTIERLDGLADCDLEWTPGHGFNSIGAILYHLALIEADWLYAEVLEQAFPPESAALFRQDARDDDGLLADARGESLQAHIDRLDRVRATLLDAFCAMTQDEFRRVRALPDYDVTPEFVLHHLMQHEAEHRGEIGMLRALSGRGA